MKAIGRRIRMLRMKLDISQEALAKKVRTTQPVVSRWEHGEVEIGLVSAGRVAKVLGTTTDWLLRGTVAA